MKLLVVAQAVDLDDPILGFFTRWIDELAKHVESVEVICLKAGKYELPVNVQVHSLGKERAGMAYHTRTRQRVIYMWRFLGLAWRLRNDYDAVFVHMNQEYVLIAGWLWRLLGKRVYLWRNHYAGSWLTTIAAAFCAKVFCTSKHSYTATYKKTVLMPVGVDTERFFPDTRVVCKPHSILFLARMSPSKRPEMLIDALAELMRRGVHFSATLVGSPPPRNEAYYEGLKEKVRKLSLANRVAFLSGVPNNQTPALYREHEIFVNASPSGMLDKTLFEAAASGCRVLAVSEDFAELVGHESSFRSSAELAERLIAALACAPVQAVPPFVTQNSLTVLAKKLFDAMIVGI